MKSINYIKNKMEEASTLFPLLNIKYDFVDNTHIIDIDTNDLHANDPFFDFELAYISEFTVNFPDEDIVFISCDDDRDFYIINDNPLFQYVGFLADRYEILESNIFYTTTNYKDFFNSSDNKYKNSDSEPLHNILKSYFSNTKKDSKIKDLDTTFNLEEYINIEEYGNVA